MLADTANLIINLTLKDQATGQLKNTQTGLSGLQKAAIGVATLGFGALTKGALQAEEAQGKFMAATGKSREEAKKFVSGMDSLAGSAGAVGVSFEDIAETGTMVEQQFGTTGDKTRDLTDDILKFAKVTGSDAKDAAADLEDTLSAYGLSADDAAGFMDKLVASNQKFGTDVGPESLDIIRNMAPSLDAMGMELDDGVELLNAFEVAGGNAKDAQAGLKRAIDELKPGENLDDLITEIGSIEDPLLKAQRAAEIFGTKAGPGLAKLIKPGMTSLDDFGVSSEEAAGKLDSAADDMLTTSDKIKGMLEKLGAGFREVGQEFGPLVTGVATAGPALSAALSKVWGGLPDDSRVKTAINSAGSKLGGAFSTAFGAAALVGLPLAAGLAVKGLSDDLNAKGVPSKVWDSIFGAGSDLQAKAAQYNREVDRALAEGLTLPEAKARGEQWLASMYGPEAAARFIPQIKALAIAGGEAAGEALGDQMVASFRQNQVPWGDLANLFDERGAEVGEVGGIAAARGVGRGLGTKDAELSNVARGVMRGVNRAMIEEAANADKVGDALADGLLDGIPDIRDAWKQFLQETKNALDPMKQITWLEGRLSGDKLAEALASKNPLTRRRAEIMRDDMMAQLNDLHTLMGMEGTRGSESLARNMDSGPAVNKARGIMQKLADIFNKQFTVGVGVKAGTGKGKKAPGEHVGGGGRAEGGPVTKGVPYIVGEKRPELFVPSENGYIIPRIPASGVSRGGGPMTVNVNLFLNGYQLTRAQEHIRRVQGGQVVG